MENITMGEREDKGCKRKRYLNGYWAYDGLMWVCIIQHSLSNQHESEFTSKVFDFQAVDKLK
jgi:hypothetical protein